MIDAAMIHFSKETDSQKIMQITLHSIMSVQVPAVYIYI